MPNDELLVLHGPEFVKGNSIHVTEVDANTVCGITPGKPRTVKQKFDGNEDSLGIFRLSDPDGTLFLLADAHYGANSGIFAIERFVPFFLEATGEIDRRLFLTHLQLDAAFKEEDAASPESKTISATTLLSLLICENEIHMVNSGDCNLFLVRQGQLTRINNPHHALFIGDPTHHPNRTAEVLLEELPEDGVVDLAIMQQVAYAFAHAAVQWNEHGQSERELEASIRDLNQALKAPITYKPSDFSQPWSPLNLHLTNDLPEIRMVEVEAGDILMMTSDGANVDVSGCPQEKLEEILQSESSDLEKAANRLLRTILKKGGRDNCALILHRIA